MFSNEKVKKIFVMALLIAATLVVYGQVHQFDFVNCDDNVYVSENPHVQSGMTAKSIRWAFQTIHGNNFWYPVLWLSFMLDDELFAFTPAATTSPTSSGISSPLSCSSPFSTA